LSGPKGPNFDFSHQASAPIIKGPGKKGPTFWRLFCRRDAATSAAIHFRMSSAVRGIKYALPHMADPTFLVVLSMLDGWPDEHDDLSIPKRHPIWSFRRNKDDSLIVTLRVEDNQALRQIDIHVKYCPVLACFDLEYWKEIGNATPTEARKLQLRKYLHQLRCDIAEEIFNAPGEHLRLGTKEIMALHAWSHRTWHNFTHSPFGRQAYDKRCQVHNEAPYAKPLTASRESVNGGYLSCSPDRIQDGRYSSTGMLTNTLM